MLRFKHQRAGLSLMEALVALFIMAIGMISLLTLFPLGAIQMGRALRDDRCAQCAWQADGVVRTWWQVEVVDKAGNETNIPAPYFASLDGSVLKDATTPGMVVAIDPIGIWSGRTNKLAGSGIDRKSSSLVTSLKDSIRNCALMDDIFFLQDDIDTTRKAGTPDTVSVAGKVVRQGRYNWMAMIQRPVNANRTSANLKILVFDGRAIGTAPANGETLQAATGAKDSTQVTINMSLTNAAFPPIGKGGWILDPGTGNRMDFYRVQSLTDNGTTTTLELDTPLKNAVTQVVILRGLAEVFDRPMLAPTAYLNPQP